MDLKLINYELTEVANLTNKEIAEALGRYPTYTSPRLRGLEKWTKNDIKRLKALFVKLNLNMLAFGADDGNVKAGTWLNTGNKYLEPTIPDFYKVRVEREGITFDLKNIYIINTEKESYGGRVRKSAKSGFIDLIPENPEYSIIQIPVKSITEILRVLEARKYF